MSVSEHSIVSISQMDWSLHRQGPKDEARHNEKVKEAIKDNLHTIISDGSIITADPYSKKIVKVPMKSLDLPRIRYGDNEGGGVGSGGGGIGDVIDVRPGSGQNQGKGAGNEPGVEYYEAEIGLEELKELVFSDLGLPNLKPKQRQQIESDRIVFDDVRRKKSLNNLDIFRTVYENMARNAQETGKPAIGDFKLEDYRVRTWRQEIQEDKSAVVLAMADISGSMGDFEKYVTRAFNWWQVNFLRSEYPKVDTVFIVHDTEAEEVTEENFFKRGSGGGTTCSSANNLALEIINNRYSPQFYNIYLLHFSDGDNWGNDNEVCVSLVREMLERGISQYAYIQIGKSSDSGLMQAYQKGIDDPRFNGVKIAIKEDILPALKAVNDPTKQTV